MQKSLVISTILLLLLVVATATNAAVRVRRQAASHDFYSRFPSYWSGAGPSLFSTSPFLSARINGGAGGIDSSSGSGGDGIVPTSFSDSSSSSSGSLLDRPGVVSISSSDPIYESNVSPARSMYDMIRNVFGLGSAVHSGGNRDSTGSLADTTGADTGNSATGSSGGSDSAGSSQSTSGSSSSGGSSSSVSDGVRHALVSLGLIGEPVPSFTPGVFQVSHLFPDFQDTNFGGEDNGNWWNGPNVCIEREENDLVSNTSTKTTEFNSTGTARTTTTPTTTTIPTTTASSTPEFHGEREGSSNSTNATTTGTVFPHKRLRGLFGGGIHLQSSSCRHTDDSYSCVTDVQKADSHMEYKVIYRCCHGFKLSERTNTCSQRAPLKDIAATFKDLNINIFPELLKQANLDTQLLLPPPTVAAGNGSAKSSAKNFTIFSPQDEALRDAGLVQSNEVSEAPVNVGSAQLTQILSTAIVDGLSRKGDWQDEQLIPTSGDPSNNKVRINFYSAPVPIVTVNCARIVSFNNFAINGIVHITDSVARPATQSVLKILRDDAAERFTKFITLIEKFPDLVAQLDLLTSNLTLFAPINTALERVQQQQPGGDFSCPRKVVEAHMLPSVICSAVVGQGRVRAANVLGNYSIFDQDVEGKVTVNGWQLVQRDMMGSNGVVHAMDGVIVPEEASPLTTVLQTQHLNQFADFIGEVLPQSASPKQPLSIVTLDAENNITIFAPNNDAFRHARQQGLLNAANSTVPLADIVAFHVARPRLLSDDMHDGQLLETLASTTNNASSYGKLRVNYYANFPMKSSITVNCARILRSDRQSCGGVIHVIDRVLIPPSTNVAGWLAANNATYSTFARFAQQVDLFKDIDAKINQELQQQQQSESNSAQQPSRYTLMAPTNEAFEALPTQLLDDLRNDTEKLKQVLLAHVINDELCCSGISPTNIFPVRRIVNTLDGGFLSVRRSRLGYVHFGRVRAINCDNIATDGVIIGVSDVILPITSAAKSPEVTSEPASSSEKGISP